MTSWARPEFDEATQAAIMLLADTDDAVLLGGLKAFNAPPLDRATVNIEATRKVGLTVTGTPAVGSVSVSGNYITGDVVQELLRQYWRLGTKLTTDIRFYTDYDAGDFFTVDLALDSNAGFKVKKAPSQGQGGVNAIYPFDAEFTCEGLYCNFHTHLSGGTDITFTQGSGADDTIADGSGSGRFLTSGFEAGQTLYVAGHSTNKGKMGVIKSVDAALITLDGEAIIETDAVGEAETILHAGKL